MNAHKRRIATTGVLVILASAGAGCRSHNLQRCDGCSAYVVTSSPTLTNPRSVQPMPQNTALLSQTPFTTDQLAREISGMHGDINRLRREVGQVQEDVNDIKTRLPAKTPEKPLG